MSVTQDMRERGILFSELRAKRVTWCLGLITSYVNVWHPSGLEAIAGELEKMNTGKTFMNVLSGIFNQILENLMISWGTNLIKPWRCYAGKNLNSKTVAWLFWVKRPNDSTWYKSPENSPCLILMLISGLYLVWMLYFFACLNLCLCEALKNLRALKSCVNGSYLEFQLWTWCTRALYEGHFTVWCLLQLCDVRQWFWVYAM